MNYFIPQIYQRRKKPLIEDITIVEFTGRQKVVFTKVRCVCGHFVYLSKMQNTGYLSNITNVLFIQHDLIFILVFAFYSCLSFDYIITSMKESCDRTNKTHQRTNKTHPRTNKTHPRININFYISLYIYPSIFS